MNLTPITESSRTLKRSEVPSLSKRFSYTIPTPASDVQQVAAFLTSGRDGSSVYAFVPSSLEESASDLVYRLALSMAQTESKPVLIMALNPSGSFSSDQTINIDDFTPQCNVPVVIAKPMHSPLNSSPLSSEEYEEFLRRSRDHFSSILVDVPSLSESVVGLLIAPHCNGIILTASKENTRKVDVQSSLKKLRQLSAPVAGFVLLEGPSK